MIKKRLIENAEKYCGVVEDPKNSNSGKVIDEIQNRFGFTGVQYCVLFVLHIYDKTLKEFGVESPLLKTASSQTLFNWALEEGMIETDFTKLGIGDIVIWRKFKMWQGHAGIVISVNKKNKTFLTIEGNTSNSNFGDQRDGGGIYKRIRHMRKADFAVDAFYLRGFIPADKIIRLNDNFESTAVDK